MCLHHVVSAVLALSTTAVCPGQSAPTQSAPGTAPADGRLLWTFPLRAPSYGSGAAGDLDGDGKPEIVFGTYFNDEHVYALNGEDGSLLWKFKSQGGPVDTSVLVFDVNGDGRPEVIFGDSAYGTLFCLDGKGEVVWKFKGQSGTDSPAAAADLDGDGTIEVVYGTMKSRDGSGYVNALRGKTGEPLWSVQAPGHVQSEPGLADLNGDGVLDVLVNTWRGDDRLRALSGKDGRELWQFETRDWVYHGVSFHDFSRDGKPEIIVADRKGHVWTLAGESGRSLWEATLSGERDGSVFGPTSLADADRDGVPEIVVCGLHLHLLDANGKLRWRNGYGQRSIARGAAVSDVDGDGIDDLVFGQGTLLRAVRADTGQELWSADLRSGADVYEGIDHAPLLLDLDGDRQLDVFVVCGRGLSGDTQKDNYGRACALRGGKGQPGADGGWLMFRGGPRHSGLRNPPSRSPAPGATGPPPSQPATAPASRPN